MKALIINCTLKKSPSVSNTEAFAKVLSDELEKNGVTIEYIRIVDMNIPPGVTSDESNGDEWPSVRAKIIESDIVILASPTWIGLLSSAAMRVIERLDGFFSEKDAGGRTPAFGKVAGFVVTGNSDGAKHVIGDMMSAMNEIGFTIAPQGWAYFNQGSEQGAVYTQVKEDEKEKSRVMAVNAASSILATTEAIKAHPVPKLSVS